MANEQQSIEQPKSGIEENSDENQPYEPAKERRVLIQTYDFAIRQLMDMIIEKELILDPDYQRHYRWSDDKASKFIESIILNIPVPVLYFAEEPDGTFSVIDGQQRLTSLFRFIKPQEIAALYPDRDLTELIPTETLKIRADLRGKRFIELDRDDRGALQKRAIRCIVVLNESDSTLKFEVFERLNTGSAALTDQEVRNCIYRGNYNNLIKNLTLNARFQEMISLPLADRKTMKDAELVLRFFAYRDLTEQTKYSDNYTEYLNSHMEDNREISAERAIYLESLFNRTVDLIYKTLGPGIAFRKPSDQNDPDKSGFAQNLINGAIYDSQMIAFSNIISTEAPVPTDLKARVYKSFADSDYWSTLSQGTSKKGRVLGRIEKLTQILSASKAK